MTIYVFYNNDPLVSDLRNAALGQRQAILVSLSI